MVFLQCPLETKIQIFFGLLQTLDFYNFSSNCNSEEIIHSSTTNSNSEVLHFTMKCLEDLYLCPGFFGELTIQNAKEILKEAFENDRTSWGKAILFLKTITDDTGKEHFTIVYAEFNPRILIYPNQLYLGYLSEDSNLIPDAIFRQNFAAVRKNPFSLETLAKVKMATSGVNLEGETFSFIPTKIKDELKKYQDVNTMFISGLAECSCTETWWHRED